MILWMYIGWMIIMYYGCRCLVSLTADVYKVGSRYDGYEYGKVTSSGSVIGDTDVLV